MLKLYVVIIHEYNFINDVNLTDRHCNNDYKLTGELCRSCCIPSLREQNDRTYSDLTSARHPIQRNLIITIKKKEIMSLIQTS